MCLILLKLYNNDTILKIVIARRKVNETYMNYMYMYTYRANIKSVVYHPMQ